MSRVLLLIFLAAFCFNSGCSRSSESPAIVESGKNMGDAKKFRQELEDKKPVR